MKVALTTFRIKQNDISGNINRLIDRVDNIIRKSEVDMIMFPEDCFTCLGITDDPDHDIGLGICLASEEISRIKMKAREREVFICFGLLEIFENRLYDSYVIIDEKGCVVFVHRRIHKGWFDPDSDSDIYGQGISLEKLETRLGSFVILICGEITDEELVAEVRNLNADFLLLPLLRSCDDFTDKWLEEEIEYYTSQIGKSNTLCFMVNGLDEIGEYFGGAWIISHQGEIIKEMATQRKDYLIYDTKTG